MQPVTEAGEPAAVIDCVADPAKTVYVTPENLAEWDLNVETKDGTYSFTPEGLEIDTTGGKVAGFVPVNFDAVTACLPLMDYEVEEGPQAGFNYRQFPDEATGREYAGLVYEPNFYGSNWWSNKDLGVGHVGSDYASYAPLRDYFTAGHISHIDVAGFTLGTLGAEVHGKGVLKSITLGDTKYTFTTEPAVTPVAPSVTVASAKAVAGGSVTVSAAGFAANEAVEVWLNAKPPVSLGRFVTDADGKLVAKVTVPVGLSKGAYTLEARGKTSGAATVSIVVEDAKIDPPKPPTTDPKPPVVDKKPSVTPRTSPVFADTPVTHKFYKEIDWMEQMGYATGWKQPAGKPLYKPSENLQRQAMAAFIYRMEAPKNYVAPKVSPFADVQPSDTFYTQIAWMHEKGYATGWAESSGKPSYRPTDSLSREAMAAFIYRLEASKDATVKAYVAPRTSKLADMKPRAKFYKEISWMYDAKLSTGNKVGATKEYWPKAELSRQAMAAFIYRLETGYRK